MSNTNASIAVAGDGKLVQLPKNFEQLSHRKQKELIIEAFRDHLIEFNKMLDELESLELQAKNLVQFIRQSKEGKRLAALRKDIKRMSEQRNNLAAARRGMMILTKKLGFDVTVEIKKLRMIEPEKN